jgi:hypothetical protein
MGLLPPSTGTRETPHDNDPWTFEAGQTVVVQPDVVTRDQTAGVQTGELCVVTTSGLQSLHTCPRELVRVRVRHTRVMACDQRRGSGIRDARSGRNAAWTSVANSSGSSQAAKWPPLSTSLK